MMNRTKLCGLTALVLLAFMTMMGAASAVMITQWELTDTSGGSPSNINSNVNAGSFVGGSGISATTFGSSGAFASQWTTATTQDAEDYFQITLNPKTGYELTITNLNFGIRRSGTGPQNYVVQWSKNAAFTSPVTLTSGNLPDDLEAGRTLTGLSILVNNGETIYIRWFGYSATEAAGTLRINDNTLSIEGTVSSPTSNPSLVLRKLQDLTPIRNGTIEVENNGNVPWTNVQLTDSGGFDVNFYDSTQNLVNSVSLNPGQKKTLTVVPVNLGGVGFGGKSVSITVTADDGTTKSTIQMNIPGSFCKYGKVGNDLEIRNIKIDNSGQGKEMEWDLLDSVEVEVEVENVGNEKVKDIFVEMGLFDSDGKNRISDLEFTSQDDEQADLGTLNDGDRETITFTFEVPADFEDGTYKLTFKAYGDDVGEDKECIDTATDLEENDLYDSIDVNRESDSGKYIAFDNVRFTPTEGTCGESVTMTLDVYNVGDEDQDQLKVNLINTEIDINSFVEIRSDLNQGDKESISFDFVIPRDATDKFYTLKLSADYDYRNGNYRESSDEDTEVQYRILGCGTNGGTDGSTDKVAIVGANLESEDVIAGGQIIVKATITNLKSQRTAFAVDASGYQSWGTLDSISPRIVDLQQGESKDVLLTFTVDEGIQGEQSFQIEAKDGLGNSELREIALNVEETSTSGPKIFDFGGDNTFLWIIGAINVILVVLIIVVAVKVARR